MFHQFCEVLYIQHLGRVRELTGVGKQRDYADRQLTHGVMHLRSLVSRKDCTGSEACSDGGSMQMAINLVPFRKNPLKGA